METPLTEVAVPLCLLYTTTVQQHSLSQPCSCSLGALCGQAVHPPPSLCWQAQLRTGGLSMERLLFSSSISSLGTWRQATGLPEALSWPSTAVLMRGAALFSECPSCHLSFPERNLSPRMYLPWCSLLLLHRGSGSCSCCPSALPPLAAASLCLVCSSPPGP